tara:strand:+ start:9426 stop:9533 length:108 start_codon:yes stop_codon:yes gene_type:complete
MRIDQKIQKNIIILEKRFPAKEADLKKDFHCKDIN